MPIKISIIVPVYNVEKYLVECLDSIINQDYKNLEIILVDDGSPDNSGTICDQYAQKDQRIIVIHQENKGLSGARNSGLEIATGDYISFIDSDDSIEQGMYSTIVKNLRNDIDVVCLPYFARFKKCKDSTIYELTKNGVRRQLLSVFIGQKKISFNKYMTTAWSLCIRRELVKDLMFMNITYEDVPYFIETILRAENILIITQKFYNYRDNPSSITKKYNPNFAKDWSIVHKEVLNILINHSVISTSLANRQNNTILAAYCRLIRNESYNPQLAIPNPAIKQYWDDNHLDEILTWKRTLKSLIHKPKILLIKLGYSNYLLKRQWNKRHKLSQF